MSVFEIHYTTISTLNLIISSIFILILAAIGFVFRSGVTVYFSGIETFKEIHLNKKMNKLIAKEKAAQRQEELELAERKRMLNSIKNSKYSEVDNLANDYKYYNLENLNILKTKFISNAQDRMNLINDSKSYVAKIKEFYNLQNSDEVLSFNPTVLT